MRSSRFAPPMPCRPQWFKAAGFADVQLKRIGPSWYRGVRRHGLIMGCSVTATKPAAGPSPLELGPKAEVSEQANTNPLSFLLRVVLGSVGGALRPASASTWLTQRIRSRCSGAALHASRGATRGAATCHGCLDAAGHRCCSPGPSTRCCRVLVLPFAGLHVSCPTCLGQRAGVPSPNAGSHTSVPS